MFGWPFSVCGDIGFSTVFGIAALNRLVMVTFIYYGRKLGAALDTPIRFLICLRPVPVTTMLVNLGFVPMALSRCVIREVHRTLVPVVVGGLLSCKVLTPLVLPLPYRWLERKQVRSSEVEE